MDYTSLIGPAVIAAGVSGTVSIIGLITSSRTARTIHREKLDFDRKLAEQKFEFDKDLAERKFKYDREFHDHKRRVELAETVLSEFMQMNDVIQAVRSPLAFGGEAVGRTRNEGETEEEARQRELLLCADSAADQAQRIHFRAHEQTLSEPRCPWGSDRRGVSRNPRGNPQSSNIVEHTDADGWWTTNQ